MRIWFFYLKIHANNNTNHTSIVLSCHLSLFTHSSFSFFFCWIKKRERAGSRLTTDDVRKRPSSWSFAFCPSVKRKKRKLVMLPLLLLFIKDSFSMLLYLYHECCLSLIKVTLLIRQFLSNNDQNSIEGNHMKVFQHSYDS